MHIEISALGPTIGEQCERLGLHASGKSIETVDRISHALTLCHIHGMLTDTEVNRARRRLLKAAKLVKRSAARAA
jgi:hypothetical protein